MVRLMRPLPIAFEESEALHLSVLIDVSRLVAQKSKHAQSLPY